MSDRKKCWLFVAIHLVSLARCILRFVYWLVVSVGLFCMNANADLLISEVFGNRFGSKSDAGHEWIVLYNRGDTSVPLAGLVLYRLDGRAKNEAWRLQIPKDNPIVVGKDGYVIISQSQDLGLGLCLDVPVIAVGETAFFFKNSGLQTLCIESPHVEKDCALICTSGAFPDGHSRIRETFAPGVESAWVTENCEIAPDTFATPGRANGICQALPAPSTPLLDTPLYTTLEIDKIPEQLLDVRVYGATDGGLVKIILSDEQEALSYDMTSVEVETCNLLEQCEVKKHDVVRAAPSIAPATPQFVINQATLQASRYDAKLELRYSALAEYEGRVNFYWTTSDKKQRIPLIAGQSLGENKRLLIRLDVSEIPLQANIVGEVELANGAVLQQNVEIGRK